MLEHIDGYGQPLPGFSLKGKATVHTMTGGCFTFLVNVIVLIYSTFKFVDLYTRDGPTINDSKIDDHFPGSEAIVFNKINWRMAFTIENKESRYAINDPRYVKWIIRQYEKRGKKLTERRLLVHRCTDEDFEMFYPVAKKDAAELGALKEAEDRGLFCLDKWEDELLLVGGEYNENEYNSLDLIMSPCNYIHHEMSEWGDTVNDECIPDLKQQLAYMGPLDVVIYMNSERFDQNEYDKAAIVKESVLLHKQVDQNSPSWISKKV